MSSPDLRDLYDYEMYALEYYEDSDGPPLIHKKSRLIAAVVQNQVEVLRDLLDGPKWYNVTDKWGYSLLQLAILRDKVEVFDYLLSIPDFPIEFENDYGQTALVVALDGFVSNDLFMSEHFSYELIKKGACFDKVLFEGDTPLIRALEREYFRTAKILIQKGVDVNVCGSQGCSPLGMLDFSSDRGAVEEVAMLLREAGAKPSEN